VVGAGALAPIILEASLQISPNLLYLVFSFQALYAIDVCFADKQYDVTPKAQQQATIWCALAMLTHPLGAVLSAAYLLLSFRWLPWRQVSGHFLILSGLLLAWVSWCAWAPNPEASVLSQSQLLKNTLQQLQPKENWKQGEYWKAQEEVLTTGATQSILGVTPLSIDAASVSAKPKSVSQAIVSAGTQVSGWASLLTQFKALRWTLLGLLSIGLLYGVFRQSGIVALYVLSYGVWSVWQGQNLVNDAVSLLFPALFTLTLYGLITCCNWAKSLRIPLQDFAMPAFLGLVTLTAVANLWNHLAITPTTEENALALMSVVSGETAPVAAHQSAEARAMVEANTPAKGGFLKATQWLRRNTAKTARVVSNQPALTYLYAQRKSRPVPNYPSAELVLQDLHRSDYVIESLSDRQVHQTLTPVLEGNPSVFRLAYQDMAAQIRIWEVKHANARL
jgi:hypothetical protein